MSETLPKTAAGSGAASPTTASPSTHERANWPVVGIFVILLLGALYFAASFVLPVVFALLFMLVLSPVVRVAQRRLHMPEPLTAVALVVSTTLVLVAGFYTLSGPIVSFVSNAPSYVEAVNHEIDELRDTLFPRQVSDEEIADAREVRRQAREETSSVVISGPDLLGGAARVVPQMAASLGFALIFLFFLLSSRSMFYQKLIEVIPRFSDKKKALSIAYEIETELSRYLLTITLINAALGVTIGLAMWIVGLPTPYVFGALAFIFNFIPYLGAIAGIGLVGLVGLTDAGVLSEAVLPMIVYFAITSIEGQFVTPILVGRRLQMNAAAVFLSVAFWGWIWGVVGMFLAVPLMVGVKIFASHVDRLSPIASFLSAERSASADDTAR